MAVPTFSNETKSGSVTAVSLVNTPGDTKVEPEPSAAMLDSLPGYIRNRFNLAETNKRPVEQKWLRAYRNYRSELGKMPQVRMNERSKASIKLTKVKVLTAFGQLIDVLFGSSNFPLELTETPVPEGISKEAHLNVNNVPAAPVPDPFGFAGDGREIKPGTTFATEAELGGFKDKFEGVQMLDGPGVLGEPTIDLASPAMRKLNTTVTDQLIEGRTAEEVRKAVFEQCLLGTGVIKGPFTFTKEIARWKTGENGERVYSSKFKDVPVSLQVSAWNSYPDPSATCQQDMGWHIERHKYNSEQLRLLIGQEGFDQDAINELIGSGPNYEMKDWESQLQDSQDQKLSNERWEILEYWGVLDKKMAQSINLPSWNDLKEYQSIQINAWVSGGKTLRVVVNPFKPARIPYNFIPYEVDPYNIWGVGIAENMDDAQMIINGHIRMAIDNLALAGNVILEIDDNMLVPGQSMEVYPGKIFRRQSGVRGNAINAINIPNTAPANIQMIQQAMQFADLETGIPSVSHGQTGISGTGRTSSGLGMILANAGLSIKTVVKNIDDKLIVPLGWDYFHWNMQFNPDVETFEGDLQVRAKATAALGMKEIRSQRIIAMLQIGQNPMFAPWFKWEKFLRDFAVSLDFNPDEVINSPAEAFIMAKRLEGVMNAQRESEASAGANPESQLMGGVGGVPAGTDQGDPQGASAGGVGPGNVSGPGQSGFTGNVT
jgi:hypothetical protein